MRALLNTGYRRSGRSSVCIGKGADIGYKDLSTFCPKAIAGIGKLPDTVSDRSIRISLKRRAPDERVERVRHRKAEQVAGELRKRITEWAGAMMIVNPESAVPEQLDDRAAECWGPLLAIADAVGGDWPEKARGNAISLMTGQLREDGSKGVGLLFDIKHIFGETLEQMASAELVQKLIALEDAPWGDVKRKPIGARTLSALLEPYGIRPKGIRTGAKTSKGYRREDFIDAWKRYLLACTGQTSATSATPDSDRHPQH